MAGRVIINVKDGSSNKYITNFDIKMKPDLEGIAGPGTDGEGPIVYKIHIPIKSNITISAKGYKDKNLNLTLVPFRQYTIYLETNP